MFHLVGFMWFVLFFFKGRSYEYDKRDPATLLLERGVIPDYEGEYCNCFSIEL